MSLVFIAYLFISKEDYQVCTGLFISRGSRHLYLFGVIPYLFICIIQNISVSKIKCIFHIFTHTVRKIYTFSMLHIVPSVPDYLCEPSQHAAHEQLSEQLCGDLHLHSPGTPSSPHALIPALGSTKCQAIHRCQWSATEMLMFCVSSTSIWCFCP